MKTAKYQLTANALRELGPDFKYSGPSEASKAGSHLVPVVERTWHPSKPDLNSDTQKEENRPQMPVENGTLCIAQQHICLALHVLVLPSVPVHIFQSCSYHHLLSLSLGYYPNSITITTVLETPAFVSLSYSSSNFCCSLIPANFLAHC